MDECCDVCGASATVGVVFHENGCEYYYCWTHNKMRGGVWEVQAKWPQKKMWGKKFEVASHRKL